VTVITHEFEGMARAIAGSKGYAALRMLIVPHLFEYMADEQLYHLAEEKFDGLIALAIQPWSPEPTIATR
jgi:hypothetical protein